MDPNLILEIDDFRPVTEVGSPPAPSDPAAVVAASEPEALAVEAPVAEAAGVVDLAALCAVPATTTATYAEPEPQPPPTPPPATETADHQSAGTEVLWFPRYAIVRHFEAEGPPSMIPDLVAGVVATLQAQYGNLGWASHAYLEQLCDATAVIVPHRNPDEITRQVITRRARLAQLAQAQAQAQAADSLLGPATPDAQTPLVSTLTSGAIHWLVVEEHTAAARAMFGYLTGRVPINRSCVFRATAHREPLPRTWADLTSIYNMIQFVAPELAEKAADGLRWAPVWRSAIEALRQTRPRKAHIAYLEAQLQRI